MHDSKVGVVALYKISACILRACFGFCGNLPLDGFSTYIYIYILI